MPSMKLALSRRSVASRLTKKAVFSSGLGPGWAGLVCADGGVSQLLALRILVNQLDVVVNVAAILEHIQAAQAHHEFRR